MDRTKIIIITAAILLIILLVLGGLFIRGTGGGVM